MASLIGSFLFQILYIMALTKKDKIVLVSEYEQLIKDSTNLVVLGYEAISVSESVSMRKQFREEDALYKVVKKKVFLRALSNLWIEVDVETLPSSIAVLFLKNDWISTLKIVESFKKVWKKEKSSSKLLYLWWLFEWKWQDAEYVSVLATLPSKEELIWKFLYMVKYPIQWFVTVQSNLLSWFVRVLDQIKEKK